MKGALVRRDAERKPTPCQALLEFQPRLGCRLHGSAPTSLSHEKSLVQPHANRRSLISGRSPYFAGRSPDAVIPSTFFRHLRPRRDPKVALIFSTAVNWHGPVAPHSLRQSCRRAIVIVCCPMEVSADPTLVAQPSKAIAMTKRIFMLVTCASAPLHSGNLGEYPTQKITPRCAETGNSRARPTSMITAPRGRDAADAGKGDGGGRPFTPQGTWGVPCGTQHCRSAALPISAKAPKMQVASADHDRMFSNFTGAREVTSNAESEICRGVRRAAHMGSLATRFQQES